MTGTTIELINVERWESYNHAPRITKPVNEMTDVGKECLKRAILECKRRFFGNKIEEPCDPVEVDIHSKIELTDREKGNLCLDPRTVLDPQIMSIGLWEEAVDIVKMEYVELFCELQKIARENNEEEAVEVEVEEEVTPPL